jgi:hypothetical protein
MSDRAAVGFAHARRHLGAVAIMLSAMSSDKEDRDPVRRPKVIKRPRVPPGPLADLKALVYELYLAAFPLTLDEITSRVDRSGGDLAGNPKRDTIDRIIRDPGMPASQADVVAVVAVLAREARWDEEDTVRRARDLWVAARMATSAGVPLAEVTDPFALEVHRPVRLEDAPPELPLLPPYVPREHDEVLGGVVRTAAGGRSGVAVLVGGSSTGKTRACWEALALLRDQDPAWRLWHPIDPTRPDAALRELPGIGPGTVVWLNEAQFYLDPAEAGLGERVAAGLRALLRDPDRAPVLVLATLWPQFWDGLTTRPEGGADPHAQARELLAGHDITVPPAFTALQLQRLSQAGDARLAQAATGAQDGQVIQFLAGAPELLARYRNAPPAAAALISAAMDARRLGTGIGLPQAFLAAAAPGYLTDTEWDALGEDWLEQALAYTAVPSKGTRGPLTRIRPRPDGRSARDRGDQPASLAAAAGPLYRLADYLDQHGRAHRAGQIPPAEFWSAAAAHAAPGDQAALGDAAHARGLYRDAAQLHKNAAASGNLRAARYLSRSQAGLHAIPRPPHWAGPDADPRPPHWAAAHVALDDPGAVAVLLNSLREGGADEQAAALLARNPGAHANLDDPGAVAYLLRSLREGGADEHKRYAALLARNPAAHALRRAGADEQAAALLARNPAAQVVIDDPGPVASLLDSLRAAGAPDQVAALAARAADRVALDTPDLVAQLLDSLREGGAHKQAAVLAARAAAHVDLDHTGAVVRLLANLREGGAHKQAAVLAARAADRAALDDPDGVARLLDSLREAGAHKQAAALLARNPAAHANLDDPDGVARLLDSLRRADADDQAAALLARNPAAHANLDDPDGVARLLDSLRAAGAHEQAAALAARAADRVALDHPSAVIILVWRMRKAGAHEQAAALAARVACRVPLDGRLPVAFLLDSLQAPDAREQAAALLARNPGAHANLDDPGAVAFLLDNPRKAGAREQAAALLARNPAITAALDHPRAVAVFLDSLREAGAHKQAAALAARAADRVALDDTDTVAFLLDKLQEAGAHKQAAALLARNPAAHVNLDHPDDAFLDYPDGVADLLDSLREAHAHDQVAALAARLSVTGMFSIFLERRRLADQFRFGLEADGTLAAAWGWEDLDLWLVPDRGDREVDLARRSTADPPNSQGKSGQSLSGRPELHCKAQLSAPAPRSLCSDRTALSCSGESFVVRVNLAIETSSFS